jgi:ribosomal protein S6--L-glutamate ligase
LHFEKVQIEELLQQPDGYGVATIIIEKKSKLTGSTLTKAGFQEKDVLILSIERGEEIIHIPDAKTRILAGDLLICYGKLDDLKRLI